MEVIQANYLRSNALFSKILNLLDIDFTNVNDPRWRRGILKVIVSFFIYLWHLAPVEMWLTDIESMMRLTLRKLLGILKIFMR